MAEFAKQSFISEHHDSMGLAVYNCGSQSCESGYSWGPALRDHHLIHIVASGSGRFVLNDSEYRLSAGDVFYAPESKMVFYQADDDDPWEYYWVGFSGIDSQRLLAAASLSAESPIFHLNGTDRAVDVLKRLYNSTGNSVADEARMTGLLYELFSLLIKGSGELSGRNERDSYVQSALKFIEHNFSSPISVSDIAAGAGISRSHLYRLFVEHLNTTPNEYLTRYRIKAAQELLGRHEVNVSEAAYSSGFSDPLYFSRVFKRIVGVAPSRYKK